MNQRNPYQAPGKIQPRQQGGAAARKVASAQRLVLFALLANIGVNILSYAVPNMPFETQLVFLAVALGVIGFVAYAMYNLAKELYSQGLAIFFAILMFVPCVSLIMLLVVNQKATTFLTGKGVKVGLMGANMNQFK